MRSNQRHLCVVLVVLAVVTLTGIAAAESPCPRKGRVTTAADVFDRPPALNTQAGWQAGSKLATLAVGTIVQICHEINVGFIGGRKTWYQIQYDGARGWVFSGAIQTPLAGGVVPSAGYRMLGGGILSVAVASAETGMPNGIPEQSQFYIFYGLLFLVTLCGMFGKVVYDEMEHLSDTRSVADGLRRCLNARKWIKAALVAPIVFLTFLQMGKATLPAAPDVSALIGFCLAFQNGFFWQTVIPGKIQR